MRRHNGSLTVLVLLAAGCAGAGRRAGAPAPRREVAEAAASEVAARMAPAASAVHWTRDAAEHDALLVQTYRWAGERLRARSAGHLSGTWGVILDADETVIDNSTYQKERLGETPSYTAESWAEWVRRKEATAVPGAASFIGLVRQLGGRVVIVSNRDEVLCAETQANLSALGLVVDVVLCRAPGGSDKNPRFERVAAGTAAPGLPPLDVLMWIGDNILDFPGLTQDIRSGGESSYADFGTRFVLLPNPMYGSWEANPWR